MYLGVAFNCMNPDDILLMALLSLESHMIQEYTNTTWHHPNKLNLFVSLLLKMFLRLHIAVQSGFKLSLKDLWSKWKTRAEAKVAMATATHPQKSLISCSLQLLCIQLEEMQSAQLSRADFQQPSTEASKSCWWEQFWLLWSHDSKKVVVIKTLYQNKELLPLVQKTTVQELISSFIHSFIMLSQRYHLSSESWLYPRASYQLHMPLWTPHP